MGRAITITAKLGARHGDGVIVAQGGKQAGYALYVRGGKLEIATRSAGKLTTVTAPNALPVGPLTLVAMLAADGTLRLQAGGKTLATGKAPAALQEMPLDGLQVGRDLAGLVGSYERENAFAGDIESVRIELKK